MGKTKIVNSDFWTDEIVEDFTPEDKLFWLFLLTNPKATTLGIYEITVKQAAFWIGYSVDSVRTLFDRFENKYGLIRVIDNEVAIRNYLRYSVTRGGKPVADGLHSDMSKVKHEELIAWVFASIEGRKDLSETVVEVIKEFHEENEALFEGLQELQESSPPTPPSLYNNINKNNSVGIGVGGDTVAYRGTNRGTNRSTIRKKDEESFDRFWSAYPKKQGKQDAFKAYKKASSKADEETLIKALEAWKQSEQWQKEKGRYIPLASTWLNGERWNDELEITSMETFSGKKDPLDRYKEMDTWKEL